MKIHRIEITNLNSLYGEHMIDWDDAFQGANLLLIHGATGAGKSTILDAISLALFGQTARLAKARAGAEQDLKAEDPRQIMSRGEAHCRAQVTFSQLDLSTGIRRKWRAAWDVRRANGKVNGKFQPPNRELVELPGEDGRPEIVRVASNQERVVREAMDEALQGMSFADFSRMVVLPQGQFADLLRSSEDDKRKLLSNMVDTAQFVKLGGRINEQKNATSRQLELLNSEIQGVQGDSASAETDAATLELQLNDVRGEIERTNLDVTRHGQVITALTELAASSVEVRTSTAAVAELKNRLADSAADRLRLARHDDGRPGRQLVQARGKVQGELTTTQARLDEMTLELPGFLTRVEDARGALAQAHDQQQQIQLQRQTWKPILERARELDSLLAADRKVIGEIEGRLREAGAASSARANELFQTGVLLETHAGVVAELEASRARLATVDELDREAKSWEDLAVRWGTARELLKQGDTAYRVAQERRTSAAAALEADEARRVEQTRRASDLAADADRARLSLDQLEPLDGRSPREVERAIQDRLRRAQRDADVLAGRARSATEAQTEAQAAGERLSEARNKLATARVDADAATRAHELAALALSQADDDLQAFQKLHTLVHHLADLHPDQPCSLCGSTAHDASHVAGLRDQLNDAGQRLEILKERRRAAADAGSGTAAALEKASRVCDQLDAAIRQLEGQVDGAAAKLGAQLMEQDPAFAALGELVQAAQAANQQLALLMTLDREFCPAVEQWEALDRAAGEARTELATSAAKLEQMTNGVRDLKLAADEAEAERDRLKQANDGVVAEMEPQAARIRGWLADAIAHLSLDPQIKTSLLLSTVKRARQEVDAELVERNHAVATVTQQRTMIQAALDGLATTVREDEARIKKLQQSALDHQCERDDILPGTTPDAKEAELVAAERKVQERLRIQNDAVQKAVQEEAEFKNRLHALEATGEQQRTQLTALGADLSEAMLRHRFADEAELMASSLGDDTAAKIRAALDQLDREGTRLEGELSAAVRRRDAAATKALELNLVDDADPASLSDRDWTEPLTASRERLQEIQQRASELEHLAGGLNAQLKSLRERGERLMQLQATRQQLHERYGRLKQLDDIIGGKDGKDFERLALALMLDRLLAAANEWLTVFQPRYRLGNVYQAGLPTLDFEVVDLHTGNEARPLSTLSGGETFMVSLSLALALSSTRNLPYRLETLLIDEGFGTLDPDTLAVVMNTLDQLQQRTGGTVAVISHVPGLADQIPAQIRVLKGPRGRSRVEAEIFSSTKALP